MWQGLNGKPTFLFTWGTALNPFNSFNLGYGRCPRAGSLKSDVHDEPPYSYGLTSDVTPLLLT